MIDTLLMRDQPVGAGEVHGRRQTGAQRIEHAEHQERQDDGQQGEHEAQLAPREVRPDEIARTFT